MQALIKNKTVIKFPYSLDDLKKDNPDVSFPAVPPVELLQEYGIYEVDVTAMPIYDQTMQRVEADGPTLIDDRWVESWKIIDLTSEEIEILLNRQKEELADKRRRAYQREADPLFFEWQRGESTQQQWLGKIEEIKNRISS